MLLLEGVEVQYVIREDALKRCLHQHMEWLDEIVVDADDSTWFRWMTRRQTKGQRRGGIQQLPGDGSAMYRGVNQPKTAKKRRLEVQSRTKTAAQNVLKAVKRRWGGAAQMVLPPRGQITNVPPSQMYQMSPCNLNPQFERSPLNSLQTTPQKSQISPVQSASSGGSPVDVKPSIASISKQQSNEPENMESSIGPAPTHSKRQSLNFSVLDSTGSEMISNTEIESTLHSIRNADESDDSTIPDVQNKSNQNKTLEQLSKSRLSTPPSMSESNASNTNTSAPSYDPALVMSGENVISNIDSKREPVFVPLQMMHRDPQPGPSGYTSSDCLKLKVLPSRDSEHAAEYNRVAEYRDCKIEPPDEEDQPPNPFVPLMLDNIENQGAQSNLRLLATESLRTQSRERHPVTDALTMMPNQYYSEPESEDEMYEESGYENTRTTRKRPLGGDSIVGRGINTTSAAVSSTPKPMKRFVKDDDIEKRVEMERNKNTVKKTVSHVKLFETFLHDECLEEAGLASLEPVKLNEALKEFIWSVRTPQGEQYEPSTLQGMFCSFERYLQENQYGYSISKDREFSGAREALKAKMKNLKSLGKGNKANAAVAITEEELDKLFEHKLLGLQTPHSMINLMWLLNTIHFGIRGSHEHRTMCWGDVTLNMDSAGRRYTEFNSTQPKSQQDARKLPPRAYETPDKPESCPVRAYLMYSEKRPDVYCEPDSPFYVSPTTIRVINWEMHAVWFKCHPMGINKLSQLMKNMCREAGIPGDKKITNRSARKFMVQKMVSHN